MIDRVAIVVVAVDEFLLPGQILLRFRIRVQWHHCMNGIAFDPATCTISSPGLAVGASEERITVV